jgi:N-methylhydantoinase A
MQKASSLKLAIDIGGTFTDTVLMDREERVLASNKTLTTHENPALGAFDGAQRALQDAGRELGEVGAFIHGTTLATNALIERRGAKVAVVATEGFRDILEIGYERRYDQYALDLQKPDLLVPRERCFTITERCSAAGEILLPLDEAAVPALLEQIDACGAEVAALCFLHAYANPEHERRLRALLLEARPNLGISLSSEVSPEAREFDRLCTTVANAYVQPLMSRYLERFAALFHEQGLACHILMMTASGGMTTLETAARFPIRLVESGPAGGAILAARLARNTALDAVLSFDMGGTTAKLCLIDEGRPQTSRSFEISRAERFMKGSGMPVRIPVIEMIEIGAGGGSIAAVDRLGRLTVGPKSAGSEPGPAAYGRGGAEPTVTDADIQLGYLRAEGFADGTLSLDPEAAGAAIERDVGQPLGMGRKEAAEGISRIVDEAMANAARIHAVESGKGLQDRTMIAFGGNGPLHACRVARGAGVTRIVIPRSPGVGSAVGFLFAPVSFEIVRSRYTLLQSIDVAAVNALLEDMRDSALDVVRLAAAEESLEWSAAAFLRYRGQGHEIEVELPGAQVAEDQLPAVAERFERAYARQFSRPVPGMEIEILNWVVRVSTPQREATRELAAPEPRLRDAAAFCDIYCDLRANARRAGLFERAALRPGDRIVGPALITEPQTTTLVAADFTADVDGAGNLVLTRLPDGELS